MSTRAVIYLRVSTDDQAEHGVSLRAQEEGCKAFCSRQGWPVASTWRDEGVSGAKPLGERQGLQDAIQNLGRGDRLVILRRDRLFRTDPYDTALIERAVEAKGARIVSTQGEGTASDSPSEIFLRRILDAKGENERLMIKQRTREALADKRRNGERTGQLPYGYRLAEDGRRVEPDPADAGLTELVRALRDDGLSLRAIGAELLWRGYLPKNGGAAWGVSTIRRILSRSEPCPET